MNTVKRLEWSAKQENPKNPETSLMGPDVGGKDNL